MASGDLISQKVFERKASVDWNRNKNFWIVGACFLVSFYPQLTISVLCKGPALCKWNIFIDRFFTGRIRTKAAKMLIADQVIVHSTVRAPFNVCFRLFLYFLLPHHRTLKHYFMYDFIHKSLSYWVSLRSSHYGFS